MKRVRMLGYMLTVFAAGVGIFFPLLMQSFGDPFLAAHVFRNGMADTGAPNLVTSIYLGYRAFDTLGETIVFMTAVSGVICLTGKNE